MVSDATRTGNAQRARMLTHGFRPSLNSDAAADMSSACQGSDCLRPSGSHRPMLQSPQIASVARFVLQVAALDVKLRLECLPGTEGIRISWPRTLHLIHDRALLCG
jgi:hypothetical protein